jgi:hypothetical protein
MTTGYAAAEVSFSGKASAGIYSSTTNVTGVTANLNTYAAGVATAVAGAVGAADVTAAQDAVQAATAAVNASQAALDADTTAAAAATEAANLATLQAALADRQSELAARQGVTASSTDTSEVFSGMDINISASVTTDNGITITVADDIGGGSMADYNDDYAIDAQTADLGTPGITISGGGLSLTVDNQAIDDRYDDSQNGDIGVAMNFAGNDIGITLDTDAAAGEASMSYSIGGAAGAVSYGLVGTDANDNGASAYKWNVAYDMNGMSLTFKSDKVDDVDAINTFGITAPLGAMSVSVSADDNEDWDASVSYSAGALGFSYATDEESAWDSNATYSLGGGATAYVGANSAEFSVAGVEFTF